MHWLDPDCLPITTGAVERFTVNLDGDVDGLVFTDRTLIHTPPHLSDQLKSAIRPKDRVRVHGVKPRGAELIAAVSIETPDGQVFVDEGPDAHDADKDEKRARPKRSLTDASGTVRLTLLPQRGSPMERYSTTAPFFALDTRRRSGSPNGCGPAQKFWCAVKVLRPSTAV